MRALVIFGVAVALFACGAILEEANDGPTPPAAPDATPGAPDVSIPDTGLRETGAPRSRCDVPRAKCTSGNCERRTLYASSTKGAPHGIVTDDTYVYWLTQPASDAGYNGNAAARVLRTDKQGAQDESHTTELARAQRLASRALALDGDWLYWFVYEEGPDRKSVAKLRRARRDCGPCAEPEELALLPDGIRIARLLRVEPRTFFAVGEGGQVFRLDVQGSKANVAGPIVTMGDFPSIVATDDHVYASSAKTDKVTQISVDGAVVLPAKFTIPASSGRDPGITNMWTDCTDVWASRGPGASFVRLSLDGGVTDLPPPPVIDVFDLAGNTDHLYVAGANQGVFEVTKATGAVRLLHAGKAFAVAVDDDGLYWGEHDIRVPAAGTLYMHVLR